MTVIAGMLQILSSQKVFNVNKTVEIQISILNYIYTYTPIQL